MKTAIRVLAVTALAWGVVGISAIHAASAATTVADCPATESQLIDDIAAAGLGGTVAFDCTQETTISFTDPVTISESVTLDATGSETVTLDGGDATRFFDTSPGATLELKALRLFHGYWVGEGGAIVNHGTVSIANSVVSLNSSALLEGAQGGAIANYGTLRIDESIVGGNTAPGDLGGSGGAIYNNAGATVDITYSAVFGNHAGAIGGAIYNEGSVTIANSLLSQNDAFRQGGAIHNGSGTVTIANSTFYQSQFGGAIHNETGTVTIANSTIAQTVAGVGISNDTGTVSVGGSIVADNGFINCVGTITDEGYNLEWAVGGSDSCGFTADTDITGQDPRLDNAQRDNGGPTLTVALLPDSPAIDRIPLASCPATDQRGFPRPEPNGTGCDIGAFEFGATATTSTATTLESSANPSMIGQPVTYTATVSPVPDGGTVAFQDGPSGIAGCGSSSIDTTTGTATCEVTYDSVGDHPVTATYSGDTGFAGSTSATLTQLVQYGVHLLYKAPVSGKVGRTVPIKLALVSYTGQNLSSSTLRLQALCVVAQGATDCSGSPAISYGEGSAFEYMSRLGTGGGYQFNVNTASLTAGRTYQLLFRAAGEPDVIFHTDGDATFTLTK